MDVVEEDKKIKRPDDADNLWHHNTPYKFRRMRWDSPFFHERDDPFYGQVLQGPLVPPAQNPAQDVQDVEGDNPAQDVQEDNPAGDEQGDNSMEVDVAN